MAKLSSNWNLHRKHESLICSCYELLVGLVVCYGMRSHRYCLLYFLWYGVCSVTASNFQLLLWTTIPWTWFDVPVKLKLSNNNYISHRRNKVSIKYPSLICELLLLWKLTWNYSIFRSKNQVIRKGREQTLTRPFLVFDVFSAKKNKNFLLFVGHWWLLLPFY